MMMPTSGPRDFDAEEEGDVEGEDDEVRLGIVEERQLLNPSQILGAGI
jgi:hypothetical protein